MSLSAYDYLQIVWINEQGERLKCHEWDNGVSHTNNGLYFTQHSNGW